MKKNKNLLIFVVIFFITIIFINPTKYISSIISGAKLFFYNVFPTVFPFIFFSNILQHTNFANFIAKILYKPINKIYHTSYYSAYLFVLSFFVGYPVSSKILNDLANENKISNSEILAISSYTSNSNPLFIIATIGVIFLKNVNFALIILVSHYTSSLLNGIIHSTFKLEKQPIVIPKLSNNNKNTNIMLDTLKSTLIVFGYITIFNLILDVLIDYKILYYLSYPFNFILDKLNFPKNFLYYNLLSLVEVTNGINALTKLNIKAIYLLPIISSAISFSGLSIILQCYNFLQNKISLKNLVYTKITQAIFAYVICFLICLAFNIN